MNNTTYIVTSAILVIISILYFSVSNINTTLESNMNTSIIRTSVESMMSIILKFYLILFLFSSTFLKIIQLILYYVFAAILNKDNKEYIEKLFENTDIQKSIKFMYNNFILLILAYLMVRLLLLVYYFVTVNNPADLEYMEKDKETFILHYKLLMFTFIFILLVSYVFSIYVHDFKTT